LRQKARSSTTKNFNGEADAEEADSK
jgi:hypothetical protein